MSGIAADRPVERVVAPGQTAASMTDRICAIALRERAQLWWWIAFLPSLALLGVGVGGVGWRHRQLGCWLAGWGCAG